MILRRAVLEDLNKWRVNPYRKPLVLRGARQVGKTTLVKEFAKKFKHFIMLNMEKQADLHFFNNFEDTKTIIEALLLNHNIPSHETGETLLFIDEIQESPKAIHWLRYFYEESPDLHVIAAGSLLEFSLKNVRSFPVGRVEFLYLHPLNFLEYLDAINQRPALEQMDNIPVKPFAHPTILKLFHRYVIIGGMPEVVKRFIETESLSDTINVYESLWSTFQKDVEKYASNETERKVLKHIMGCAHLYIDQRVKFQHFGTSNYRSREVGEAFRSLDAAKVIQLIYPTNDIIPPLKTNMQRSPRLQLLDTGLTNYALGIQSQLLGLNDMNDAYRGSIIPHIAMQELISLNTLSYLKPHFWVREKNQATAEVDLVITYEDKVIPIEIKSGTTGSLKSLHQFVDLSSHPFAIRLYAGDFKIEKSKTPDGKLYYLMNLPYYLVTKIHVYIKYFIDNYKSHV